MSASVLYMSMSLDGYIAGPNDGPGNPGGDGFGRLHEWYGDSQPSGAGPSKASAEFLDEMNATGAVLAGRRDGAGESRRRGPERNGARRVHGAAGARGRGAG